MKGKVHEKPHSLMFGILSTCLPGCFLAAICNEKKKTTHTSSFADFGTSTETETRLSNSCTYLCTGVSEEAKHLSDLRDFLITFFYLLCQKGTMFEIKLSETESV